MGESALRGAADGPVQGPIGIFCLGDVTILPNRNLVRHCNDETIVQPQTMRLICALAEAGGETLSRQELIVRVWDGLVVSDSAIDRAICNARKALGDCARSPKYIETVRKRGFRLMQKAVPLAVVPEEQSPSDASSPRRRFSISKAKFLWFQHGAAGVFALVALSLMTLWPTFGNSREAPPTQVLTQATLPAEVPVDSALFDLISARFGEDIAHDEHLSKCHHPGSANETNTSRDI